MGIFCGICFTTNYLNVSWYDCRHTSSMLLPYHCSLPYRHLKDKFISIFYLFFLWDSGADMFFFLYIKNGIDLLGIFLSRNNRKEHIICGRHLYSGHLVVKCRWMIPNIMSTPLYATVSEGLENVILDSSEFLQSFWRLWPLLENGKIEHLKLEIVCGEK